jgi:hypothetical protein
MTFRVYTFQENTVTIVVICKGDEKPEDLGECIAESREDLLWHEALLIASDMLHEVDGPVRLHLRDNLHDTPECNVALVMSASNFDVWL